MCLKITLVISDRKALITVDLPLNNMNIKVEQVVTSSVH